MKHTFYILLQVTEVSGQLGVHASVLILVILRCAGVEKMLNWRF